MLVTSSALVVFACTGLAVGYLDVADEASRAWQHCEAIHRKRVADLPRIVIGEREITYRGELIATVEAVIRDDSPIFRIDALHEKLVRDRSQACEPTWVCLDQLVVVQFEHMPDSRLLGRLANTIWTAGYDFLHVQHAPTW